MSKTKYLIHDAAQLVGIASQTLRHYEEKGIISYSRDKNSGYRCFDPLDIHIVVRSRLYRAYGFTLDGVVELLNEKSLSMVVDLFKKREKAMSQELAWMRYLHNHLKAYIARLEELEEAAGCFRLTERPPLFGLMYRRGEEITGDSRLRRQVSKWMDYAPLPQPLFAYNMDMETGMPSSLEMGLCLNSVDAKKLRVRAGGNVFYLEPLPCAYSVVKLSLERKMTPSAIFLSSVSRILEEMKQRDLRPAGTVYGRTVVSLYKDLNQKLDSYQEYWIPYIPPPESKNYS